MEILTDMKHWVGWLLTASVIIGIFHLMGVHALYEPITNVLLLIGIIVIVDVIKHRIGLQ